MAVTEAFSRLLHDSTPQDSPERITPAHREFALSAEPCSGLHDPWLTARRTDMGPTFAQFLISTATVRDSLRDPPTPLLPLGTSYGSGGRLALFLVRLLQTRN